MPTENKSVWKIINSFCISLISVVSPAFAFGRNDSRHSSSPAASHQLTNTYIRTRSLRYEKNYLTLILPSLLSGCAGISGSNNVAPSDTPALVFVDGQISESAGVLALTQQRLSPPKITPPESQRARDSKKQHIQSANPDRYLHQQ